MIVHRKCGKRGKIQNNLSIYLDRKQNMDFSNKPRVDKWICRTMLQTKSSNGIVIYRDSFDLDNTISEMINHILKCKSIALVKRINISNIGGL